MLQTIILSLKKQNKITVKTHEKVEIMFEIHFLSLLIIFTNDIKEFFYSSSTNDEETITNRKLIRIVHKIDMNKISEINEMINRMLKQLIAIVTK